MKRLFMLVLMGALPLWGQGIIDQPKNPCNDPIFQLAERIGPDSLSERQWEYLKIKTEECQQYRQLQELRRQSAAQEESATQEERQAAAQEEAMRRDARREAEARDIDKQNRIFLALILVLLWIYDIFVYS